MASTPYWLYGAKAIYKDHFQTSTEPESVGASRPCRRLVSVPCVEVVESVLSPMIPRRLDQRRFCDFFDIRRLYENDVEKHRLDLRSCGF
jgi:hypothetical protein